MTITMNGYDFNLSRVDRVLSATSLSQAQDMGPLDSLMDWARGGVKREAIAKLYNQISQAGADGKPSPPSRQLARFEALRALVTDENLSKFQVKTKVDTATNTWGYEFLIDRTSIASQDKLPFENGRDYADFNGALRVWLTTADWFPENHREEAKECMLSLHTETVTDRQKVENFQRLQELAGEAHKSRFQTMVEMKPAAYKVALGLTDDSASSPGEKHTLYTLALGIEGVKDFSLERVSPAMDAGFVQRSLDESRANDKSIQQFHSDLTSGYYFISGNQVTGENRIAEAAEFARMLTTKLGATTDQINTIKKMANQSTRLALTAANTIEGKEGKTHILKVPAVALSTYLLEGDDDGNIRLKVRYEKDIVFTPFLGNVSSFSAAGYAPGADDMSSRFFYERLAPSGDWQHQTERLKQDPLSHKSYACYIDIIVMPTGDFRFERFGSEITKDCQVDARA